MSKRRISRLVFWFFFSLFITAAITTFHFSRKQTMRLPPTAIGCHTHCAPSHFCCHKHTLILIPPFIPGIYRPLTSAGGLPLINTTTRSSIHSSCMIHLFFLSYLSQHIGKPSISHVTNPPSPHPRLPRCRFTLICS